MENSERADDTLTPKPLKKIRKAPPSRRAITAYSESAVSIAAGISGTPTSDRLMVNEATERPLDTGPLSHALSADGEGDERHFLIGDTAGADTGRSLQSCRVESTSITAVTELPRASVMEIKFAVDGGVRLAGEGAPRPFTPETLRDEFLGRSSHSSTLPPQYVAYQ